MIAFKIPGKPPTKHRPRFVIRNGRVWTYSPQEEKLNLQRIATYYKRACPGIPPTSAPVAVLVRAVFKPGPRANRKYPSYADIDNILKAILDGLNGVAWKDDRQVIAAMAIKSYGNQDATYVYIAEYDENAEKILTHLIQRGGSDDT